MRGRYLMREYWSDSDLFLLLKADEREVYIGLWMLADDEGWLPRDVPAIAKDICQYQDRGVREPFIRTVLDRLRELGKVQSFRCCLFLPAVKNYPRAGKKTSEHMDEHQRHSNGPKGIRTDLNPSPVPSLPDPSQPVVAGERAGGPRSLRELMPPPPGYRPKASA